MRKLFLVALILLIIQLASAEVVINEIMYNPSADLGGTYNEWIELYNNGAETTNLTGWKIADPVDHIITGDDLLLLPNSYIILAKKPENFSDYYNVSCSIADAAFYLSNSGEEILLKDSANQIIDNLTYDDGWGADGNGKTLQKINPSGNNSASNWRESLELGGTPGKINFPEHDIAIQEISIYPDNPVESEEILVTVFVLNKGLSNESNINFQIKLNEEIYTEIFELSAFNSTELSFYFEPQFIGNYTLTANITTSDNDLSNNFQQRTIAVSELENADVNMIAQNFTISILPQNARVEVSWYLTPLSFDMVVAENSTTFTNFTDLEEELTLDFGYYTLCANITDTYNYNDTDLSNNFACSNITLNATLSQHRIKLWTDKEKYELNDTINWVVQLFLPKDSTSTNGNLTVKLGKKRPSGSYNYYAPWIDESKSYNTPIFVNGTYEIPDDSIEGIYKIRAKFDYGSDYIDSYDNGIFWINGLEDLGEPELEIITLPEAAVRFGDFTTVFVKFTSNNYNAPLRLIAYPDKPSHVAMDLRGETIYQKYCEKDTAVEIDITRGQTVYASLPIFLKQNCDSEFSDETYTSYVRTCEWTGTEWEYMSNDYKKGFNLAVSGRNDNYCVSGSRSSGRGAPIVPAEEAEESASPLKLISAPSIVNIQDPFEIEVRVENNGNSTKEYSIYSYVYEGKKCVSEGFLEDWKAGWTANKQELTIPPKSDITLTLKNRIKQGAEPGTYSLRIRLKEGSKNIDSTKDITVLEGIYTEEGNFTTAASPVTGKTVYVSETSNKAKNIIYLVLFISVLLNIIFIRASR